MDLSRYLVKFWEILHLLTCMHTHADAHTHMHKHTYTHIYAHTHTCIATDFPSKSNISDVNKPGNTPGLKFLFINYCNIRT